MPSLAFNDFSGGLWIPGESAPTTEQAGFELPQNGLLRGDNIDFLPSGAVRGRRGSSKDNSTALAGAVRVMKKYYPRDVAAELQSTQGLGYAFNQLADFPSQTLEWAGAETIPLPGPGRREVAYCQGASATSRFLALVAPFLLTPVPTGATITGFAVKIMRNRQGVAGGSVIDADVRLIKNGSVITGGGANRADLAIWRRGDNAPTQGGRELIDYGDSSDLWGSTWTPADVNSIGFGVALSVAIGADPQQAQVFWMNITCHYTDPSGTGFVVGYVDGANLIYASGLGTYTPISGGSVANPTRRPWVVAWPQKSMFFFFDGENPTKQYDGSTITSVTPREAGVAPESADVPKGPFACLHKSRLWATRPGELQYSVYASEVNNECSWPPELQLSVNDERGGRITGLASYGDVLLIFKSTGIWAFLGDPRLAGRLTEISTTGCVAPDSIAVTPHGVVFVGREGVFITDGGSVVPLSDPIRPLFVERSDETVYTDAVGVYYPRRDQYWLHLAPGVQTSGYVLSRVRIPTDSGDRVQLAWARIPSLPMNCGAVWEAPADEGKLYLGDRDGFVWLRDVGQTDAGMFYGSTVQTLQRELDPRGRRMGRVSRVKARWRDLSARAIQLWYDQTLTPSVTQLGVGDATASPEYQEPREYVADKTQFGRFISFSVLSNAGPRFELSRVDLDIALRGARVWR